LRRTAAAVVLGALGAASLLASSTRARADGDDDGFVVIERRGAITVATREEPGRALPTMRAQGTITGNVVHVLAVVLDDARSHEWAEGSDEARVLRQVDGHTDIVYSRSHQPWPVRDRDLVMRRTVSVLERGQAFRVRLECIGGEKAPVDGVLRIRDCLTLITLRAQGDAQTYVDYQVRVDAAGDAPTWLVRRASLHVPLDTLLGLEKQVAKTRDQYPAQIARLRDAPKS
jgi:hypothetical protein